MRWLSPRLVSRHIRKSPFLLFTTVCAPLKSEDLLEILDILAKTLVENDPFSIPDCSPLPIPLVQEPLDGGFRMGVFPNLHSSVPICPFWGFPDLFFSGFPDVLGIFSMCPFPFLGLKEGPTRNIPERVRNTVYFSHQCSLVEVKKQKHRKMLKKWAHDHVQRFLGDKQDPSEGTGCTWE